MSFHDDLLLENAPRSITLSNLDLDDYWVPIPEENPAPDAHHHVENEVPDDNMDGSQNDDKVDVAMKDLLTEITNHQVMENKINVISNEVVQKGLLPSLKSFC
jgi:hypothetical protein